MSSDSVAGSEPAAAGADPAPRSVSGRPDAAFWSGRRVLVTGHTGFKGSWLALWLEALGADVTGYALTPPTDPNLFEQAGVAKGLQDVTGDVRDFSKLASVVVATRPDVVIHMAAQSVVKRGYVEPIETYSANVMGTVHVLEAVRQRGAPCAVVIVTSDKCYAHNEASPGYREDDPLGGDDPYSSSKGCAELVTAAFRQSYFPPASWSTHGVGVASARAGNVIGGGDWTADRILPDLVRSFSASQPCLIRNPGAIRPWQFVLEPLRGYLLLAERLAKGQTSFMAPWNFGPPASDAKPVSWIADRMRQGWGDKAEWTFDDRHHPAEAATLRLDSTRSIEALGWRPALSLDAAMSRTCEWYRCWHERGDVANLSRQQIVSYQRTVAESR
jgi:CDP-glucose 4,6-dehydratase